VVLHEYFVGEAPGCLVGQSMSAYDHANPQDVSDISFC
jgi:hypothetical protein